MSDFGWGSYRKIELSSTNVSTSIRSLYNHLLALDLSTCEGELVARTARRIRAADSCKTVGEVVIDSPWHLAAGHVRSTLIAAGLGVDVCDCFAVHVAGLDWRCHASFVPCARGFAAVPRVYEIRL